MISEKLRARFLPALLLILATFAVYARTLGHDFLINWDDNAYVTVNSSVHGFSLENIRTVFTSYYAGNYAPLQMLSYMFDFTLWGLNSGGFLLTNIVLHTINGLMLYAILRKSHGERLLAIVGAAIFLLHPVQVESVAWISQRKNLLAMLFMLLSWAAYIRYRNSTEKRGGLAYFVSVAAFLCSLLSKSASVFFPVALLLYDYCFIEGRKSRLFDKIPFFILAGAAAVLAIQSQSPEVTGWSGIDHGGRRSWHGGSPWATLLTMIPVFCSYLRMLVWPAGLSAVYAPSVHLTPDLTVLLSTLMVMAAVYLSWRLYRFDRRFGYWPFFSLVAILPVSQIIPLVTLMNDRYLYFPMIGVAALGGAGVMAIRGILNERMTLSISILLLMALALTSFQRAGVWKSSRTLWSDAVRKVPGKYDAWEGLGEAYHLSAPVDLKAAEVAYSRAFALYSSNPDNLYNLARVRSEQGDDGKGTVLLKKLLQLNPEHVKGWAVLGDIYFKNGLFKKAEQAYRSAEVLQPEAVEVSLRLGNLYLSEGDFAKARSYFDRAGVQDGEQPLPP